MTITDEEYQKQGEKQLPDMVDELNELVAHFDKKRKKQVESLLESELGQQFMTAPASTRRKFHNAFSCGLLEHSLRVVRNALSIHAAVWNNMYDKQSVVFSALFHDLGKAGAPGKPFYLPQTDQYWVKKGEFYVINQEEFMPNSERSIYTLASLGIEMTYEEMQAIRLNDGMGPKENSGWSFKETPLALIVHHADHSSMIQEKLMAL
jgi:hypothetical protein